MIGSAEMGFSIFRQLDEARSTAVPTKLLGTDPDSSETSER